jgi:hypothetical protein
MTPRINDIQHNNTQQTSIEFYFTEERDYLIVIPSVFMLNVLIPSVVAMSDYVCDKRTSLLLQGIKISTMKFFIEHSRG